MPPQSPASSTIFPSFRRRRSHRIVIRQDHRRGWNRPPIGPSPSHNTPLPPRPKNNVRATRSLMTKNPRHEPRCTRLGQAKTPIRPFVAKNPRHERSGDPGIGNETMPPPFTAHKHSHSTAPTPPKPRKTELNALRRARTLTLNGPRHPATPPPPLRTPPHPPVRAPGSLFDIRLCRARECG